MLKSRCSDPDIFDSDRLAFRFQCRQQVSGTDGFGLTEWKNVD
jgi:hypothetical protein